MSDIEAFRSEVEAFLKANSIPPTTFGRMVANDAMLVSQLREGREPRSALRRKIQAFIAHKPAPLPKTRGSNAGVAAS